MITGFNTDVEHDGIIYHVQTEDKGLDTPLMLSLVYTGGAILASKRVRYDDLIAAGFDERVLAERLLRQHKLICAAIRAGRLEELKKMTERDASLRSPAKSESTPVDSTPAIETSQAPEPPVGVPVEEIKSKPPLPKRQEQRLPPPSQRSSPKVIPAATPEPIAQPVRTDATVGESLHLVLVDEKIYRGGDRVILRVRVEDGTNQRHVIPGADVIVKILGSTFRPLIYQTKTAVDGIAAVRTELPHFRSGRAAILVRVTVGRIEGELRRIIQQG